MNKWDFIEVNTKETSQGFHTYPAMLVPQIASELLFEYGKKAKLLFDPFCGTGTTLVEANIKGINAIGTDLNPLARLISKVKTTRIDIQTLDLFIKDFYDYLFDFRFNFSKHNSVTLPSFKNINYWFSKNTINDLEIIRNFINNIKEEQIKDFFKVSFSQTIRNCSWSRKNEFKLYKMDKKKIKFFKPDVFSTMEKILSRNRSGLISFSEKTINNVSSIVYDFNSVNFIPKDIIPNNTVNIIITSPPYGDSQTTVAYGQYSRLTNQWLESDDPFSLDKQLMGGIKCRTDISFPSRSLNYCISKIKKINKSRSQDVVSFYNDYMKSIYNASKVIRRKGFACYIVSNRCVKGITLRTDKITREFFEQVGFYHIDTIERKISNKRLPRKNSPTGIIGETKTLMNKEYIVIMQKK